MKEHYSCLKIAVVILLIMSTAALARSNAPLNQDTQLESSTGQYLEQIEDRLEKSLKNNEPEFPASLRNVLIKFSMLGPMANISSRTLEKLGGSKTARTCIFFVMPVIRWMSEPAISFSGISSGATGHSPLDRLPQPGWACFGK